MAADSKPKDVYSRMVEMAFKAEVPGATAHDRLKYLQDLLREHGLQIVDQKADFGGSSPPDGRTER
jgi:hypothetical protein